MALALNVAQSGGRPNFLPGVIRAGVKRALKADFHSLKSERAGEKRNVNDVSACVVKQNDYVCRRAPAELSTLVKVKSF